MLLENVHRSVQPVPSEAAGGVGSDVAWGASERLDRVASELHLVAERLRESAAFRSALARASAEEDEGRIDYLHP